MLLKTLKLLHFIVLTLLIIYLQACSFNNYKHEIAKTSVEENKYVEPELLFLAKLERLEVIPREQEGCQDPEIEGVFLISNHCGCAEAKLSVGKSFFPSKKLKTFNLKYRIEEWCEVDMPIDDVGLLIIKASNMPIRWFRIVHSDSGVLSLEKHAIDIIFADFKKQFSFIDLDHPEVETVCGWRDKKMRHVCKEETVMSLESLLKLFNVIEK